MNLILKLMNLRKTSRNFESIKDYYDYMKDLIIEKKI